MVTSDALVTRQDQSLSVIATSQVEVEVALTSIFHPKTAHVLRPRETTKKATTPRDPAPAMFATPLCRTSRRNASKTELVLRHNRFVGSD